MSLLSAVRDVRHFSVRHLVSKPHPGVSHAKPKGLVSVGFRGARHHYTLLNQMLMNSDLHSTAPFMRTRHSMSSGERQRFDLQMAECGRYTESRLSGQEGTFLWARLGRFRDFRCR